MQGRSIGSKRIRVGEAAPQPTRASIYQEENTPLEWTAAHDLRAQLALPQRPAELHPRALRHGLIASQLGLPMLAGAEKKHAPEEWEQPAAESVVPAQAHAAYSGATEYAGLDWSNNEQTTRYDEWELQKELVTYEETYPGYDTYDEHPRLDFQLPPVAAGHDHERAARDQRHELDYAQAAYAPAEYAEHEDHAGSPGRHPYAQSAQPSAARWHTEQPIRRMAEPRTATQGSFANPSSTVQARTGGRGQARVAPTLETTQRGRAAHAHSNAPTRARLTQAQAQFAAHTSHASAPAQRGFAAQAHAAPSAVTTHAEFAARTHAAQAHAAPNAAMTHAGLAARTHAARSHAAPNASTTHAGFAARTHAAQAHAAPSAATTHAGFAARTHAAEAHAAPNAATTHAGFPARTHAAQSHAAPNAATTHAGFAARTHAAQAHAAPNAATTHAGFAARTHAAQAHAAPNAAPTHAGFAARSAQVHAAPNAATTHAGFAARAAHSPHTHAATTRSYGAAGASVQARAPRRAVRRYADDEPVVYPRGGSWLKRFVVLLALAGAGYAGQHYYFNYYQRAPTPVPAPPPPPAAAAVAPAEPPAPPAPASEPSEAQAAPTSPETARERRSAARAALIAERWRERHAGRRGRDDDDSSDDRDDSPARGRSYARASDERDSSYSRSRASSQRGDYADSEASPSERNRSSTSANDDYVSDRHAAAQSGTLRINSLPWSQVHIDGQLVGHTPQMNLLLPAGKHRVTLVNNEMQLTKSLTVQITPGNITTHTINLAE